MTWRDKVTEMVKAGCFVQVHYGSFGIGCTVTDPNLECGINVAGKDDEDQAVNKTYESWDKKRAEWCAKEDGECTVKT